MRTVLVHYHIFKNAGSTVDLLLQNTFGQAWRSFEGSNAASRIKPEELVDFLVMHPQVKAVSSHHLMFPVPASPVVEVLPLVFLRHPLDRVRSVYEFERKQGQMHGPVSLGAEHAARLSLGDYLRWRFGSAANGVVHNCQTTFLLGSKQFSRRQISAGDFDLALQTLCGLRFFGLVEDFDASVRRLGKLLEDNDIPLSSEYKAVNVNPHRAGALEGRLADLREEVGETMWAELLERNAWDMRLYENAVNRLKQ